MLDLLALECFDGSLGFNKEIFLIERFMKK
jgi:hypothetical protein